jgi:hypothetical protein
MLKRLFAVPAVYHYAYVDNTNGKACVVQNSMYGMFSFLILATIIHNSETVKNARGKFPYSGTD